MSANEFLGFQCRQTKAVPGDGIDNDCDGLIDEEIKDGRDNDDDKYVDEDLELVNFTYYHFN